MSDIDIQIAQLEKEIENKKNDLNRYQEQVKRLEVEIEKLGNKFKTLSKNGRLDNGTKNEIVNARIEKRKQLESYKKMINQVKKQITDRQTKLKKLKSTPTIPIPTKKIIKSEDPFSRLYDTSHIVPDEATERDLEELMRQNPIQEQKRASAIERVEDQKLDEEERLEDLDKKRPTPEQIPLQDFEMNDEYFSEPKEDFNRTPIVISNEPSPPPVEEENEEDLQKQVQQKLHPLATDNDDAIVKVLPQSSSSKITRKTPDPGEIEQNDPKIDLNQGVEGIQMDKVNLNRKQQISKQIKEFKELLEEKTDPKKSKLFKEQTGFSETLVKPSAKEKETPKLDKNVCKNIFKNGSKVNEAQFFPSEFPKLTRINPITITLSNKKGGKRKTRKNRKNRKIKKS